MNTLDRAREVYKKHLHDEKIKNIESTNKMAAEIIEYFNKRAIQLVQEEDWFLIEHLRFKVDVRVNGLNWKKYFVLIPSDYHLCPVEVTDLTTLGKYLQENRIPCY